MADRVPDQLKLPTADVALNGAFTPHKPIKARELLAGRMDLLWKALDVVRTDGLHLILFGDRGVGKTSIARVLGQVAEQAERATGTRVLFVSCNSTDTFASVWERVIAEVQIAERPLGYGRSDTRAEPMSVAGKIKGPHDVKRFVQSFPNPTVIVIDEFDRVPQENDARRLMADTIKLFSDNDLPTTIVLVGVAGSIGELIAEHHSITRHAAQLEVKPMDPESLAEIIRKGFGLAGMTYDEMLDERVAEMSHGYPSYTHLLGLWSGRKAIMAGRMRVSHTDLDLAIPEALENATGGVRHEYEQAVESPQPRNIFREVLLACALAKKDAFGKFRTADVRQPLSSVTGKPYDIAAFQSHLAKFTEKERGPVLLRSGRKRGYKWQFTNPQLVPYIRLQGVNDGRIGA